MSGLYVVSYSHFSLFSLFAPFSIPHPQELSLTIKNEQWQEDNKKKKLSVKFPEYIDYYIGKRIKTKYTYHPYKLTFDYLELNEMDAIKLFWVFGGADRDSSGIIDR